MKDPIICMVGLGYVGMPLAIAFSKRYQVIGFDLDKEKCENIRTYNVSRDLCSPERLHQAIESGQLIVTDDLQGTRHANVYIVAVPTPIDKDMHADPTLLLNACRMVGKVIGRGDMVIFESTVWPGMTEESCVPLLEEASGLVCNKDFTVGYSPERINPSDPKHPVEQITKIVSASTPEALEFIDRLYNSVLLRGTYKAPSIRVAEASKIMENCQRDVLIAFTNEMFRVLGSMNINVEEVIAAAKTKWNFVEMHPGLVGGHCIPVDPYYLIDKAAQQGIDTPLLKTAREVNNRMAIDYAARIVASLKRNKGSKVLLLGFAFKPNCDDTRNTRVADVYHEVEKFTHEITVCDPLVDAAKVKACYGIDIVQTIPQNTAFDVVAVCTEHDIFEQSAFINIPHKGRIMHLCKRATR